MIPFLVDVYRQEKQNLILSLVWKMEVELRATQLDKSPLYGAKTETSKLMGFVKLLSRTVIVLIEGEHP